jgi:pimeloyl-ACP methyl ester carboxylesterase
MTTDRILPRKQLKLANGITLDYVDEGSGPTVVFIAGLLANGDLWRKVISRMKGEYRCIAFDLPLGAHRIALPQGTDVSPRAVAQLIAQALAALDLHEVTLVGVDTGGALCQLVYVHHGERIARMALSNCDAFEAFLPPLLRPFQWVAFMPGGMQLMQFALRFHFTQHFFLWLIQRTKGDKALLESYFASVQRQDILRDLSIFMRGIHPQETLQAAERFPQIAKPTLLVWARGDFFFTDSLAERLSRTFAQCQLEWIPQAKSKTFVSEDAPDELTQHLTQFIRQHSAGANQSTTAERIGSAHTPAAAQPGAA